MLRPFRTRRHAAKGTRTPRAPSLGRGWACASLSFPHSGRPCRHLLSGGGGRGTQWGGGAFCPGSLPQPPSLGVFAWGSGPSRSAVPCPMLMTVQRHRQLPVALALQCEWLLGDRKPSPEELDTGIDPDSPLFQAILDNPVVQLGLTNPKTLLGECALHAARGRPEHTSVPVGGHHSHTPGAVPACTASL